MKLSNLIKLISEEHNILLITKNQSVSTTYIGLQTEGRIVIYDGNLSITAFLFRPRSVGSWVYDKGKWSIYSIDLKVWENWDENI